MTARESAGAGPQRVTDPLRLTLVLTAIAGILGMHALVVGAPAAGHPMPGGHAVGSHATAIAHGADTTHAASTAVVAATPDTTGPHGSGHDPADHTGLAHLCLALAAGIFLLLVRRFLVPAVLAGPPGPVVRVRAAAARWIRPPPDLVGVLCVSRT